MVSSWRERRGLNDIAPGSDSLAHESGPTGIDDEGVALAYGVSAGQ